MVLNTNSLTVCYFLLLCHLLLFLSLPGLVQYSVMFILSSELVAKYSSDSFTTPSKLTSESLDQFIVTAAQLDNVAAQVGIYKYVCMYV